MSAIKIMKASKKGDKVYESNGFYFTECELLEDPRWDEDESRGEFFEVNVKTYNQEFRMMGCSKHSHYGPRLEKPLSFAEVRYVDGTVREYRQPRPDEVVIQ